MDFDITPAERPPQDRHRPGFGWAMFIIVVGFLIAAQLGPYLERESAKDGKVKEITQSVRLAFFQAELQRRLTQKSDFSILQRELRPLEPLRKSDPQATLLWALGQDLQAKDLSAEDLSPLTNSKTPRLAKAAEILRAKSLSQEQVSSLIEPTSKAFPDRLLRVAALRRTGEPDANAKEFSQREVFGPMIAGAVAFLGILAGIVILIAHRLMSATGRIRPAGFPGVPVTAASADRYVGKAAIALLLTLTLPAFVIGPMRDRISDPVKTVVVGFSMLGIVAIFMALPLFGRRITWREIGWRRDRLGDDFVAGIAALLANAPLLVITALASTALFRFLPPAEHPITKDPEMLTEPAMLLATLFVASIVAPIVEETIFRGMVSPAMAHVFKPSWVGWLVSGFCFAAIHPTGIPAWAPLAMLGAVASATNYQTGSLVSSVFMHGIHNAAVLGLTLLFFG